MGASTHNDRLSRREFLKLGAAGAGLFVFVGCGGGGGGSSDTLTIAYQPGIGYAQFLIMKEEGWLEEALPEKEIRWQELASGSAIRDGMVSGDINVGSGGVGPFLIGWAAGVGWKLLSSLNNMDLWLMVNDDRIQSLEDFGPDDRIAMPAPDSIQAVVLKRGAQEQLRDAAALDENIVSLEHPSGLQSLLSGQVAGHLTSPPFQFQEQDEGARAILKSYDLFGESTFNSVFVREEVYEEDQETMDTLYQNIQRGIDLISSNPERAARILSQESGGEESAANFQKWMTEPGVTYTNVPAGFEDYAAFMQEVGLIEKTPGSWQDLVYPTLNGVRGS